MEKHKLEKCDDLIFKNKNILIKTKNDQHELESNEVSVQKEVEENSDCINEEFADFGHNFDKYKNYNSEKCIANGVTKSDDYVFESELEINIPNIDTQETEAHKLCHKYTKKLKCTTCSEQFLELSCLKSHLMFHVDNYIKCLENEFVNEKCNNVDVNNSNLCYNMTMLDGLKTNNSDGVQIKKGLIHNFKLGFTVEFQQPNIQNCLSTIDNMTDSQECFGIDLAVENSVNSVAPVECKSISVTESYDSVCSVSVDPKECTINDEESVFNCAKCNKLFENRSSIEDHLKPNTNQCINCCKNIDGTTMICKFPVGFKPGTPVYFECDECYNEFYTLRKFLIYQSAPSKKKTNAPYQCDICLKKYIDFYHFAAHQRLHEGERPYQCNLCNKRYHARFNLEAHLFSHENFERVECYLCLKQFRHQSYLKLHMLSHNNSKLVCNVCRKEFKCLSSLRKHQDLHPRYKPHRCDECGKTFSLFKSFQQHLKRHSGLKPYKCTLCDVSCSTFFEFKSHKRLHNGYKPYKCDICKDVFDYFNEWERHKKTHVENKMFECDVCQKKFTCKTGVKQHLINTHFKNIDKHECKVCNKKFNSKSNLKYHEKIHLNLKQYVCDICRKSFISQYNFTEHLNQHTGVNPFECEFCDKKYPAVKSLKRHKKNSHECDICNKVYAKPNELKDHKKTTHKESQAKSYVCEFCNSKYSTQTSLYRHKKIHLVGKQFKCDICPKSYLNSFLLEVHKRKHSGERPYKCNLCYKSYTQPGSLNRHKVIVHK